MVKTLINSLEYLGYRLYRGISCVLPLSLAYFLADLIGFAVCIFTLRESLKRARIMRRIKGDVENPFGMLARSTRYFNRDLVDFFRSGRLNHENIDSFFKTEGLDKLDDALAKKKGVVLVSSHMGSWEMGGICLAVKGYPIYGMVWEPRNRWVSSMLGELRSKKGVGAVASSSLREVIGLLEGNSIVAIMSDVDGGNKGILYELWGYNVRLPRGPAALSAKTGAEMLVVVLTREPSGRHRLVIEKPLVTDNEKNNTIEAFGIIKRYIEKDPAQWHWLKYFFNHKGTKAQRKNI